MLHADSTLETTWHCVTFGHARCGSLTVRKVKRNIYICYKLNEEERVHDGVQSPLFVWKDQQSNTTGCNMNIYAEELQLDVGKWGESMNAVLLLSLLQLLMHQRTVTQNRPPTLFFFWLCLPPPPPTVVTFMKIVFVFLIRKFSPKWFWSCTWVNWTWSQNLYHTIMHVTRTPSPPPHPAPSMRYNGVGGGCLHQFCVIVFTNSTVYEPHALINQSYLAIIILCMVQ